MQFKLTQNTFKDLIISKKIVIGLLIVIIFFLRLFSSNQSQIFFKLQTIDTYSICVNQFLYLLTTSSHVYLTIFRKVKVTSENLLTQNQNYQKPIQMKTSNRFYEGDKIKNIFCKDYELRNHFEHKSALQFLQPYFSTLSQNTVKLITFYIQVIHNNSEQTHQLDNNLEHGILITFGPSQEAELNLKNPQSIHDYIMVKNQKPNFSNKQSFGLYISYDNYLSCLALGQSSIEEELQFFHTSEYLCSMPRKKYYNILRNSKVLSFSHRQNIYFQGQMISPGESGSGVYLVRHGQMAYVKKIKDQNVQVFRFGSGHLLGTLELEEQNPKRLFSVKCKTGRSVVYQMSQEFFNSFIKPYCQNVINQKQKKLEKFLSDKSTQISQFRKGHSEFNLSLRRSLSQINESTSQTLKSTKTLNMFTSRDLPSLIKTTRLSSQIQAQGLRKTSYMGLKYDGPLKNYPMVSNRSKFTQSQFKDIEKLMEKNDKITTIREIKRNATDETRQSILFRMFQNSWKFEKQKRSKQN